MAYTLALGPFAPALLGPQRFVFKIDGDTIADVEYRGGFNERGCAERLSRLDLDQSLFLVSRICATCSHAHSMAFCQALEALFGLDVSPRAAALRSVIAEIERVASHLVALEAIAEALGQSQIAKRFREAWNECRELTNQLCGVPMLPNVCELGGLRRDIDEERRSALLLAVKRLNRRLFQLADSLVEQRMLLRRTVEVGAISRDAAAQFGLRGPLARAAGLSADARIDQPYAAYAQHPPRVITQEGGDVYGRWVVLLLEAVESSRLAEALLSDLPAGAVRGNAPERMPAGSAEGCVEAPRGLLRYRVISDGRRLSEVTIDAPRQLDRLLARALLSGAQLDDAALIVLSTDPCTACAEA